MTKLALLASLLAACGGTPGEGDVDAGAPDATPVTIDETAPLVTGLFEPNGIAADDRAVYWVEHATIDGGGAIRRYDLVTGVVDDLADAGDTAQLELTADHVYWVDQRTGAVSRVGKDGGAVEILATEGAQSVYDVAADDERIYWVTPSLVHSARHDGTDVRDLAASSNITTDVFVADSRVLWVASNGTWAVDKDGGTRVEIAGTTTGNVISGGDHVFVSDRDANQVIQDALDGTGPTPIATGVRPGRLAFADGQLYWANISNTTGAGPGGLWTMSSGAPPELIAPVNGGAVGVAVTAAGVFFSEMALGEGPAGAIWAAPR
jgi:hypothetical protein